MMLTFNRDAMSFKPIRSISIPKQKSKKSIINKLGGFFTLQVPGQNFPESEEQRRKG